MSNGLWNPDYARPTQRSGDYRTSSTRYGRPVDVWRRALAREREFTFDLGVERPVEQESWRVYAPVTAHEKRLAANACAREALVRWYHDPGPAAQVEFLTAAEESIQFRRLAKRFGLNGREPMKLEDLAENEGVSLSAVQRTIVAALESLPRLPVDVGYVGLRDIALITASLTEQRMFIEENILADTTPQVTLVAGEHVEPGDITELRPLPNQITVGPGGTSWASDSVGSPSLMDAYTDGWIACFEGGKDTSCHFRNKELRKKWHQGYREAAQELAARREVPVSMS